MQCVLSRNKFFLFVDNLVVYVEYTKELKGKKKGCLEIISKYNRVTDIQDQ